MSSKDFMRKHISKYDESWTHMKLIEMGRHHNPNEFPRFERVVNAESVSERVVEFLQEKWVELMTK